MIRSAVLRTCLLVVTTIPLMAALLAGPARAETWGCAGNGFHFEPPEFQCALYYDSGVMAIKPWRTVTSNFDPSYHFWAVSEYNYWTTGRPVTTASSATPLWVSATYTNWGVSDTHYARTTALALDAFCLGRVTCLPAKLDQPIERPTPHVDTYTVGPTSVFAAVRRGPAPGVTSMAPLAAGASAAPVTGATAVCPAGELAVHTDSTVAVLSRTSAVPSSLPQPLPLILPGDRAARATVRGSELHPGTQGLLTVSVICGETRRDRVFAGTHGNRAMLIGSQQDETLHAPAGGALVYAGDGTTVTLTGGSGNDVLYAGSGHDTLDARGSSDVLIGGSGINIEHASSLPSARTLLVAGAGQNTLVGGPGHNDIDSEQGSSPNTIVCAGHSIVRARHRDHITGHCTRIIYVSG